ncbi:MAG: M14 family metallopeptidase [Gemmatimonadota bacterium]
MNWRILAAALVTTASTAAAQDVSELRTAPERTEFAETTRYEDVLHLMETAAAASPVVHLTTFGYSMEGRPLPLAVVGEVPDASAASVRESGRTVVYLQGNIHGGEVEGKEVLLMLLREFAEGAHAEVLDSLVLLVAPILNADGNERVQLTNRGAQHGPIAGTGTRPNAQGLNINRDHMKLDSPEARSFALLLRDYDPHLAVDLHTTNGTRHAYHLTYSPPLHPNLHSALYSLLRERLFPEMTRNVRDRQGWDFYYYGNVQGQEDERGWYTFDYRALFNNNYLGLRNRPGLLSEAYSYATFQDRITATRLFVDETLRFSHAHASEIRELVAQADATSIVGDTLALRAEPRRSSERVEILMGEVVEDRNPYTGEVMLRRTDVSRPERMWEFGTFAPTVTERVPRAYLIPPELGDVLDNLAVHGVRTEPAAAGGAVAVERFRIASQVVSPREFEGRFERTIEGAWEMASVSIPAGTVRVSMDQPLARLIFSLLEPRSGDGLATWGTLDAQLEGATTTYPILRLP